MSRRISGWAPALAAVIALGVFAPSPSARAADETAIDPAVLQQMVDFNKQALAALKKGKPEIARSLLLDAVLLGKQKALARHEMSARTYVHLGIVYADGLK